MRYNSIGEYFYRLSNRCLGLALLPIILVWAAYLINQHFYSGLPILSLKAHWLNQLSIILGISMLLLFWLQRNLAGSRLKKLIPEPSLGARIKRYIPIVMGRFFIFSFMLLLVGSIIFMSAELVFLNWIVIPVFSFLFYWPGHWRISKDLKLKPEEREILKNRMLGV